MLTCKQTSELISARYDRKLGLGERVSMRVHLLMCKYCSAVARQIDLIQKLVGLKGGVEPSAWIRAPLPVAARERITRSLHQAESDSG
jgi:Putative zinc-finger